MKDFTDYMWKVTAPDPRRIRFNVYCAPGAEVELKQRIRDLGRHGDGPEMLKSWIKIHGKGSIRVDKPEGIGVLAGLLLPEPGLDELAAAIALWVQTWAQCRPGKTPGADVVQNQEQLVREILFMLSP